ETLGRNPEPCGQVTLYDGGESSGSQLFHQRESRVRLSCGKPQIHLSRVVVPEEALRVIEKLLSLRLVVDGHDPFRLSFVVDAHDATVNPSIANKCSASSAAFFATSARHRSAYSDGGLDVIGMVASDRSRDGVYRFCDTTLAPVTAISSWSAIGPDDLSSHNTSREDAAVSLVSAASCELIGSVLLVRAESSGMILGTVVDSIWLAPL